MVATVSLSQLLVAAGNVGVHIRLADEPAQLYAWTTETNEVVYIGKSESLSRVRNEAGWVAKGSPKECIYSGIVTLLRVNRAQPVSLNFDEAAYDPARWQALRAGWDGSAFVELDKRLGQRTPTLLEVEELLIRIAVRYGAPLGNSQFHSQWEGPIDRLPDTLAVLAVDADPTFVVPKPRKI